MQESLFSSLWYRYSQQRPQLRSHVTVQQQRYRDQVWYLLIHNTNGNHFRINHIAYQFIGRLDGSHTVEEIWNSLLESLGDNTPTQDEIIKLLAELDQKDLVRYDAIPDIPRMFRRKKQTLKQKHRVLINPFSFGVPLWNPSKLLNKLVWLQKLIFSPITFFLWAVTVTLATLVLISHWNELSQHASRFMTTPHYLFLAWLSFPFIKALHELGHGLAVCHWGGQVKETGITFFVLTPAPYVDASASHAFRSRHQRVIVDAIGIMIELFLAALAMLIWFSVQSGLVQDIAFVIMFICGVSSLLFNGNPLLRFDAYYMLCDTFDMPNLAVRSKVFWENLIQSVILGKENTPQLSLTTGEFKWLLAYAPLSKIYSLVLVSYIVLWLAEKSVLIGTLLAVVAIFSLIVKPLVTFIKNIIAVTTPGKHRRRAKVVMASLLLSLTVLLVVIPAPYNTTAQGVVWMPEQAYIRPITAGVIKKYMLNHGDKVEKNQTLLILEDSELMADRIKLNNQLNEMKVEQYNALFNAPSDSTFFSEKIDKIKAELQQVENQISGLEVRSQVNGVLVIPHQNDSLGTFVKKGTTLGYVLNKNMIKVRSAIPEQDAELILNHLKKVEVRTADHPNEVFTANVVMSTPAVTYTLPSAALGDHGGGRYITDPEDKNGLTSLEPLVLVDLNLPTSVFERAGTRAYIRFDYDSKPIAMQVYRHLRQLFLRYFNTSE